jgi:hypothetical protein
MHPDPSSETSAEPSVHSEHIQHQLTDLIDHLHTDIERVSEPRFQALLETSAEVLNGLKSAFASYDRGKETAWRR